MSQSEAMVFSAPPVAGQAAAGGWVSLETGRVYRLARLFVAGEYPDRGVTVTEEDIDRIIARFSAAGSSVPVKVEHIDSPLDPLGTVEGLYRRGPELFGMLVFSAGMDQHLRERDVENVSIALVREPEESGGGFVLKETSLVLKPRVQGAGFLSAAAQKIAAFRQAGKLTPAMEPHAAALLSGASSVLRFSSGGSGDGAAATVAEAVEKLLEAMPVIQPRGGMAAAVTFGRGPGGGKESEPSGAVMAMARSFGVDAKKVAANMLRQQQAQRKGEL